MKFNFLFILFITLTLSCSKAPESLHSRTSGPLDIVSVKKWYFSISKGSRIKAFYSDPIPDWDKAESKHFLSGDKFLLQIPFKNKIEKLHIIDGKFIRIPQPELIVYVDSVTSQYTMGIMEIVPTYDYYESHVGTVSMKDFTGKWYLKELDGGIRYGFIYENGKITGTIANASRQGKANAFSCICSEINVWQKGCAGPDGFSVRAVEVEGACGTINPPNYISIPGYDCSFGDWQFLRTNSTIQQCFDSSNPNVPILLNNNAPIWRWGPDEIIISNLNKPCYKSVLNDVINNQFKGKVQSILNTYVNSPADSKLSIMFEEATNDPKIDGINIGNKIYLNDAALTHASKEYIAATIYHEVLHVYIPASLFNEGEHNQMATNYIYPIAEAIRGVYPTIPWGDAVALAWGGLGETNLFRLLTKPYRDEVESINAAYKSVNGVSGSTIGTRCN